MKIFNKIGKKIDDTIDRLSTCPACSHRTDTGVSGCTCRRSDCMCKVRRDR